MRHVHAALIALAATLWFTGCSSSTMRYNMFPRQTSYESVATSGSKPALVVNPVKFARVAEPDPWQKELATKLQDEFVGSVRKVNLMTPIAVQTPHAASDDALVLDVTVEDSCVESPIYYVFVMGEKQHYFLRGEFKFSRNGRTIALFKFAQDKAAAERMFGSYVWIPIFPFGSARKDIVVDELMNKLLNEFEMFMVRNQDGLRSAARAIPIDTTGNAPANRVVATAATTDWQVGRAEHVGRFRVGPTVGFGIDISENTGLERYEDITTFVGGGAFGIEASMNPHVGANGILTGKHAITPEIWGRFSYLETHIGIYLKDDGNDDDDNNSSSTLISKDEGGEKHYSIIFGGRPVFKLSELYRLFLEAGVGFTWGSQEGDVVPRNQADYPDVEYFLRRTKKDHSPALQTQFGGGVRFGHPRSPFDLNLGFDINNCSSRDETIILPTASLRFRI